MAKTLLFSDRKSANRKRSFSFFSVFSLKPFQNNLLTGQTKRWIISVAIIISIIALIEGCIWVNIFNFYFGSNLSFAKKIIFSVGIGLAVFLVIWIVDSSVATMDMTRSPVNEEKKWYLPTKKDIKQWTGVLFRIMLLAITLYATIPALTRLSISEDIQKIIKDDSNTKIAGLIKKTEQEYDTKLKTKESLLNSKRSALTNEIGGGPGSSGYGDKVVAKSIREAITALETEIGTDKKEKENKISEIRKATNDELSKNYGIQFIAKLPGQIEKISKQLEQDENYKMVEKISRVYAVLSFLALLLLKLFAPGNVAIYFNEDLQDLFDSYLNDQINPAYLVYLQNITNDVTRKNITPSTFYDFWKNYCLKRNHDLNSLRRDEKMRKLDEKVLKLNKEKREVESAISEIELSYTSSFESIADLKNKLEVNRSEADNLFNQKKELEDKIRGLKDADLEGISPEDFIKLAKQKPILQNNLEIVEEKIKKNMAGKHMLDARKEKEEENLKFYKDELGRNRKTIISINGILQSLINKYINSLDDSGMRVA